MLKRLRILIVAAVASVVLYGCGAAVATPALGVFYTDIEAPLGVTSNEVGKKVGTGKATSILGLVATGDASINSAARSAGITRISHVDYKTTNILGFFATFEVRVYGE